jgi:branched-chain amino acid transport system substrate-binding protein
MGIGRISRDADDRRSEVKLPRRGALLVSAALAVLIAGCGSSTSTSKPKTTGPINIGALTSITGTFAPWGLELRDGMQFAVNQINRAGGIDGRKLNLVVADDMSQPATGITAFDRLTEQDHVVAVGGIIDSDVGVATAPLAERAHIPLFMEKAGAANILTLHSRYTFRTCLPAAPEVSAAYVQYAASRKLTRVGAIDADYAWGQSIGSGLMSAAAKVPGMKLKIEVAPVTATDFSTYLRSLSPFKPQIIFATGDPPGTPAIIAQSAALGLDVPVTGPDFPSSLIVKAVGKPAFARYIDFKCMLVDSPGYQNLARQFLKAYPQAHFFEDDALSGYAIVNVVADAIRHVGANPVKIAAYLHAHTFNIPGYAYPLKWTYWGELADARLAIDLLTTGPAPSGTNVGGTWYLKQLYLTKPLVPYRP